MSVNYYYKLRLAEKTDTKNIVLLGEKRENTRSEREKQRLLNNKIIQCLIDLTLCLDIGGKPFCGHYGKKDDVNKGLFLRIIDFKKKWSFIEKILWNRT